MGIVKSKVTSLETKILLDIADCFPYVYADVKTVYIAVKSFDITITILDQASRRAIAPGLIILAMKEQLKNEV